MEQVNEKNTSYLTVNFLDKDGNAALPDSISYTVRCETTGTAIRAATAVGAATSVTITLDSSDNTIQDTDNKTEIRNVTITALYGATDQISQEYRYELVNLGGIS
jgi:hypothetical protein